MRSRVIFAVLVVLMTLLAVMVYAGGGEEKGNPNYMNELGWLDYNIKVPIEKERELYRIDIKQKTPEDGIWTGHVIAYGHYIKPPYKFEIVDDTLLFLNGIQIEPRLKLKRDEYLLKLRQAKIEEAKKDPLHGSFERMVERTREIYKAVYQKEGRAAAIDSVRAFLANHFLVHEVTVTPSEFNSEEAQLRLFTKEGIGRQVPFMMTLRIQQPAPAFPQPRSEEERREMIRESLEISKSDFEGKLRMGKILLLLPAGKGHYAYCLFDRELIRIIKIMLSSSDLQTKLQELRKMTFLWEVAREIIYNFSKEEWPDIKDLEEGRER